MNKLKYNVGDKVRIKGLDWYNENMVEYGYVPCEEYSFEYLMTEYCGRILTIIDKKEDCYLMNENLFRWTDEMIECKVEEECPQDFIEKYCISCGTQRCDRTKEYLDGCPYYNAYMSIKQNNTAEEETKSELVPYFKEGTNKILYYKNKNTFECYFPMRTPEYICPKGYIFKDENGNVINTHKIVLEKKKKEYPKTYEECCKVLNTDDDSIIDISVPLHYNHLLISFTQLLICRDAYWKIAGEEMRLGKPWKPTKDKTVYSIYRESNEIETCVFPGESATFEFPTEEMRDAFYENFKKEIEFCKELL